MSINPRDYTVVDRPEPRCLLCLPTPVPDGRAMLDAFKAKHGIKSDDHARSLMFIETFKPLGDA